jgi:hypothetical protein
MIIIGCCLGVEPPSGGLLGICFYISMEGNLGVEWEEGGGCWASREKENFNPLLYCIIIVIGHHYH